VAQAELERPTFLWQLIQCGEVSDLDCGVYLLMALIANKPFQAEISLRNSLHLVEVNMFERITLAQMVANALRGDAFSQLIHRRSCFEIGKIAGQ